MGGVASGRDARELLDAGATLVAVGTESFRDPAAGARIARELEAAFPANCAMIAVSSRPTMYAKTPAK